MFSQIQIIIGAIVAVVLAAAVGYGVYLFKDRQYQKLEKQYAELQIKSEQIAKETTNKLEQQKAQADVEKANEVANVTKFMQSTVDSLRKRQSRPAKLPQPSETAGSCTGAELYREDAEFLAGEAARAETVRIERDYYYQRYEDARIALDGANKAGGQAGSVSDSKPVSGN